MYSMFFESVGSRDEDNNPGILIFRQDLAEDVRKGPVSFANDLDIAIELLNLTHEELKKFGTDGSQILDDVQIFEALRSLRLVLKRLDINLNLPFRNFSTFKSYWLSNRMSGAGGWQARRDCLELLFDSPRKELEKLEDIRLTKPLANPAKQEIIEWPEVDEEIRELRKKFESAVTPQDFRALGPHCIGALEAVGCVVYDPSKDLREDEKKLPYDRIKERLDRFIERRLPGDENKELRSAVKACIVLTNRLKHRTTPSALMAGIAADSTILLISMIRRIADPSFTSTIDDETPF